jgi:hypothetical protein
MKRAELSDRLPVERHGSVASLCLEYGRLRGHFHALIHLAKWQFDIDAPLGIHGYTRIALDELAESRSRDGQFITSDNDSLRRSTLWKDEAGEQAGPEDNAGY